MKPCDDVQLALSCEEALSEAQSQHLSGCVHCQAHQREVSLLLGVVRDEVLEQPPPARLERFAEETRQAWQREQQGRQPRGEWARLAMAAGLGAVLASAGWAQFLPGPREVAEASRASPPMAEVAESSSEELLALEFPEVAWPDEGEGDVL